MHPFRPGASSDDATARLAELVARLRPEPRQGLLALRALALSLGPDVVEEVGGSAVTYARREAPFLTVELVRSRLLASFPAAIHVEDPMGRLLRRGEQRYFRVEGTGDLDAHVQGFVRRAYAEARA